MYSCWGYPNTYEIHVSFENVEIDAMEWFLHLADDLAICGQRCLRHDTLVLHREHILARLYDALVDQQAQRDACTLPSLACIERHSYTLR